MSWAETPNRLALGTDGNVAVSTGRTLFEVAGLNGKVLWSVPSQVYEIAADHRAVYGIQNAAGGTAAGNTIVFKFDAATGAVVWQSLSIPDFVGFYLKPMPDGNVVVDGPRSSGAEVFELDGGSGAVLWAVGLSPTGPSGPPE